MKRNNEFNMSVPHKRSRPGSDDPELRLLIPSKVAGSIIGKGGKNISRLRTTYNASITVPDCPGPERVVTIGTDYETALKVVEEIVPNIAEFYKQALKGRGDELDVKLLVHQSQAGCIIGKAGVKVKELREKAGARIKIFSNCCPQSTDRVVAIAGVEAVCLIAIKEVVELLKTAPVKGYNENYDPHNYDEDYAEEYGGYGGGRRSLDNHKRSGGLNQMRLLPRGDGRQLPPPSSGRQGPMRGGVGFGGLPPGPRSIFSDDNGREEFLMGPGPVPSSGALSGVMMGSLNPTGRNTQSMQVTIPKDLAGAIIGKAGSRIRKIRSDSGATIVIDEPLPGSNDRIITITGFPSEIQMAQYLLQQSVHESVGARY